MRFLYPFAKRLAAPVAPGERLRVERMLASARLFLAIVTAAVIYFAPSQPADYVRLTYALMMIYVLHSVVIILLLRRRYELSQSFARNVHAIDVLWPTLICLFTQGPNSPYFFIFFPLLAAAFRWGFRATFLTAVVGVGLLGLDAALIASPFVEGEFDPKWLVLRGITTLLMGLLLGYAAEEEKQLRAENMTIARLAEKVRSVEGRLSATLQEVFDEMMRIFGASHCAAVVRDIGSSRVFLWDARRVPGSQESHLHLVEPQFEQGEALMAPAAGPVWLATRQQGERNEVKWQVTALDLDGRRVRRFGKDAPPIDYLGFGEYRSLLGVSFNFGDSWSGQMLIFDPHLTSSVETELRFAQNLLQQVGPAIYNLYLVRQLRSRAGAIERARAARELHDGAIQSLIAAEMRVDVLRRKAAAYPIGDELEQIQQILRQEVLGLRELMQQMKPVDVTERDVLDFLAETVDRFRRDTGIDARFISELDDVLLSSRVCRELVRITQEALVNIRKHSGASSVIVRFKSEGGHWKLLIEDDGRGFLFSGRLTGAELQATHQGPSVIRERVRSIGGDLTVDSAPGQGARLEVAFPQQTRATHA